MQQLSTDDQVEVCGGGGGLASCNCRQKKTYIRKVFTFIADKGERCKPDAVLQATTHCNVSIRAFHSGRVWRVRRTGGPGPIFFLFLAHLRLKLLDADQLNFALPVVTCRVIERCPATTTHAIDCGSPRSSGDSVYNRFQNTNLFSHVTCIQVLKICTIVYPFDFVRQVRRLRPFRPFVLRALVTPCGESFGMRDHGNCAQKWIIN